VLESILFVVAKLGRLDHYAITAKISCVSQKWECRPKMAVSAENGGVIQQWPCSVENVLIPKLEQPCQPKMPVADKVGCTRIRKYPIPTLTRVPRGTDHMPAAAAA
jgi:hypothetical protein